MIVYAIDPGKLKSAVAVSRDGILVGSFFVKQWGPAFPREQIHPGLVQCDTIDRVVYEHPRYINVKGRGQSRGKDPNDLIDLALSAGWAVAMAYAAAHFGGRPRDGAPVGLSGYTPTEWKGGVPKPIHHSRLWAALSEPERDLFQADTYNRICQGVEGLPYSAQVHNLLDAAALNLFACGRLGRGGSRA